MGSGMRAQSTPGAMRTTAPISGGCTSTNLSRWGADAKASPSAVTASLGVDCMTIIVSCGPLKTLPRAASSLLLAVAIVSTCTAAQPQDAKLASAIRHSVEQHQPQAVELLQRVVDINSGTMNFDGVRKVSDVFRREFEALGFKTE